MGLIGEGEIGVRGRADLAEPALVTGMVSAGTASASLGPRRAIILIKTETDGSKEVIL